MAVARRLALVGHALLAPLAVMGAARGADAQASARVPFDTVAARAALDSALALPDDGLAPRTRQTIILGGMSRRYLVGSTTVQEGTAPLSWRLVSPRVAARVSGAPLALDAAGTALRGATPLRARVDMILRAGDTISVYGRSASGPRVLDSAQALAVGAAGTSVVDLESMGLGVAAQVGARGRLSFPVGEVVLGTTLALERDLRPPATGAVFWQGTTIRAGTSVTGFAGEQAVSVGADVSYSRADSLGGRNQFPGGGAVTLSASTSGAIGADGDVFLAGDIFYVRPFGNVRNDQPTRLIPQGSLGGINGMAVFDTGPLTWTPTVAVLREASSATLTVQQGIVRTRSALNSSAWSLATGLSVDVPVTGMLTLSPEVGGVFGSVGATLSQTTGAVIARRGRIPSQTSTSGFTDPVRGWWGGVSLRIRY